ncbi:MAG: HigA family addiction module antitoxin [Rhizomicrobium sp.]
MDRGELPSNGKTARRARSISSKTIKPKQNRRPTHPGEVLRDIVLSEIGLSVSEAARQIGVSRQMLHAILAGKASISAEMALRLGRFCGNGPALWLNMQQAFDLWQAKVDMGSKLDEIPVHLPKTAAVAAE